MDNGVLQSGLTTIQWTLTGVLLVMAVIAAVIVACKNLPRISEQGVMNQIVNSLLGILAVVAIVAIMIWAVPWIWGLFVG